MITKGPPERGSQGPRHDVGLRVALAPAKDFSAAGSPRSSRSPEAVAVVAAAGGGTAGPGRAESCAFRQWALRLALRAREAPIAGGRLDRRQARVAATSGKAYK